MQHSYVQANNLCPEFQAEDLTELQHKLELSGMEFSLFRIGL